MPKLPSECSPWISHLLAVEAMEAQRGRMLGIELLEVEGLGVKGFRVQGLLSVIDLCGRP